MRSRHRYTRTRPGSASSSVLVRLSTYAPRSLESARNEAASRSMSSADRSGGTVPGYAIRHAMIRDGSRPARLAWHILLRVPEVEAHITGTVWKIEVDVGDSVQEGDTVVILESMKMEMPVEAEDPGVVKEILVEEGQSVSEGDTLVVLE